MEQAKPDPEERSKRQAENYRKKNKALEKRYRIVFKKYKTLETLTVKLVEGLYQEYKRDIFSESDILSELGEGETGLDPEAKQNGQAKTETSESKSETQGTKVRHKEDIHNNQHEENTQHNPIKHQDQGQTIPNIDSNKKNNKKNQKTKKKVIFNGDLLCKHPGKANEMADKILKHSVQIHQQLSFTSKKKYEFLQMNETLKSQLENLKTSERRSKEETAGHQQKISKLGDLLNDSKRKIKDLENRLHGRDNLEHSQLMQKLKKINEGDSKEQEMQKKLAEKTDVIISLRRIIDGLKLAKSIKVLPNQKEIVYRDQETQKDIEFQRFESENTDQIKIENLKNQENQNSLLKSTSGNYENGKSVKYYGNNEKGMLMNGSFREVQNNRKFKEDFGRKKNGYQGYSSKSGTGVHDKMDYLRDLLKKYFVYRIEGKTSLENLTLKVLLESLDLDSQKRANITQFETKAKGFFKFF